MVHVPEGQLFLDGVDVNSPSDLRGEVAMVPQEGFLFTSTLADNLRYGDPHAGDDQVEQAAEQALADDVKDFLRDSAPSSANGASPSAAGNVNARLWDAPCWSPPVLVLDDA